ncbi:MAG: flagellar hook-basal body complex protein FliE [Phycisphaerae bacterium]|nr:flagellar hook-basal body complex protein FliE [Phycisphaerae bacterium]
MSDPLGIISNIQRASPALGGGGAPKGAPGDFREELLRQIGEVNKLQEDATVAAEDVLTGRRNDVEGVMLATRKADSAFRLLLAVRNKVMDAYDEVKQMRV